MIETREDRKHAPSEAILEKIVEECLYVARQLNVDCNAEGALDEWRQRGLASGYGNAERILSDVWSATEKSPAERQHIQNSVRVLATELNEIGAHYIAKIFCNATEQDHKMIFEYARRHGCYDKYGLIDCDLTMAVQEYGDAAEIDQLLALQSKEGCLEGSGGQVEAVLANIRRLLAVYADRLRLPLRRGRLCHGLLATTDLLPTAAMQLKKRNYDIAIGILHGGAPIAHYLHPLDQSVGYLEWHEHWKRDAVWRAAKRATEIRNGMRVLLCENDARSGNTLGKVMRKVDATSPSSVDVCFTGIEFEHSRNIAQSMKDFGHIFHITDLSQQKVFSDMLEYQERLKSVLYGLKTEEKS